MSADVIAVRIRATEEELAALLCYDDRELQAIIREVGFACDNCGRCCTHAFNDHVFLLDRDTAVVKAIDPLALVPAPYFDFCDQHGRFYVGGYALKTRPDGTCVFLSNNRCTIYDRRFSICRVYPYMLHREPDEHGHVDWRQISGLNQHGEYNTPLSDLECSRIAGETREYETLFLNQQLRFLRLVWEHFAAFGLKHVRKVYDQKMRAFLRGAPVSVLVYYNGTFEEQTVTIGEYPAD
ncbi:YkgJ family cysteine cluster protein [Methanosphaerula palustris]|uniref:Uncharacterized protein n=1 Tax=Methanosphaerula palustris (strain ATCC BAA-1556 / DSM 19958 / E1-9c) TaxID=521011 RepID=B8GDP5_METPE|nr:YkgJ family cysteine cluster protein [Methanosphaerula palustris]ACL17396.1 protein of unknown function UPF0153 [Methanosphaerula palustris E1-9c]